MTVEPFPIKSPRKIDKEPDKYGRFPLRGRQPDGSMQVWTGAEVSEIVRAYSDARSHHGQGESLMAVIIAWQRFWSK